MYIYLKNKNLYQKLARIDRASNTGTITGSIWNTFPVEYHLGVKDIHFTYPSDGEYHVSANMNDGTEIKVFSDRAAIKKSSNARWERIEKKEVMPMIPMAMVPDYKPAAFTEYIGTDKFFPVMTMGMGRLDIFDTEIPKTNDFVIDCEHVDVSRTPNFSITLFGEKSDLYARMKLEFIDSRILFDEYPKVFVALFYGRN